MVSEKADLHYIPCGCCAIFCLSGDLDAETRCAEQSCKIIQHHQVLRLILRSMRALCTMSRSPTRYTKLLLAVVPLVRQSSALVRRDSAVLRIGWKPSLPRTQRPVLDCREVRIARHSIVVILMIHAVQRSRSHTHVMCSDSGASSIWAWFRFWNLLSPV